MFRRILTILLQAFILASVASMTALTFNFLRPSSMPLVAGQPYMIYKDCPMMPKEAKSVQVAELPTDLSEFLVVDARSAAEFEKSSLPGSRSLPYHPIKSPPARVLDELKRAGPNRLLVVGDVEINSGRLLAAELSEAGCLGVRYVEGGWPALVKAGRVSAEVAP